MDYLILALNPGSTSTKFAVYKNETPLFEHTLRHSTEELKKFDKISDQFEFRKDAILNHLAELDFDLKTLSTIIGRGGALRPVPGGTYEIDDMLLNDLIEAKRGEHASNLGGIIANELSAELDIPTYIADPPAVDELSSLARVSGLNGYERESKFHALNQKAVAKRYAKETGKRYDEMNLLIAHLGGGISVGAHEKGRVVDVFDAFTGDGAFSPERSGGLPTGVVIDLCMSGDYTKREIIKKLVGGGGINSYLGINDMREVALKVDQGDEKARLVYEAMAYQVAKDIGAMSTVLHGEVDQIILTGGIAFDKRIVAMIKDRCSHLGDFTIYPGEDELEALALSALGVLKGETIVKNYAKVLKGTM